MKRRLAALALLLPLLAGCSADQPDAIQQAKLQPCMWEASPATGKFFSSGFECLDGSGAPVPSGFPAPAIVNVWGSWCPPCRDEIPYFLRLATEHEVTIVGVDVDEPSMVAGQRFALNQQMPWPNLFDREGASTAIFGPGVPVTWFIDASGTVVKRKIGVIRDYDELLELARTHGQIR